MSELNLINKKTSELNINDKKFNEINWELIIIKEEFQNYFNIDELSEISLVSKLVRSKLKSKLFSCIEFNGENYAKYFINDNIISGYFGYINDCEQSDSEDDSIEDEESIEFDENSSEYESYDEYENSSEWESMDEEENSSEYETMNQDEGINNVANDLMFRAFLSHMGIVEEDNSSGYETIDEDYSNDEEYDYTSYKDFKTDLAIQNLEEQLTMLKPYVKNFNLSFAKAAGCYLLPLACLFDNLTSLGLLKCMIPITEFNNLSKSLRKLNAIELSFVSFTNQVTDEDTIDEIHFSKNLKQLSIVKCKVITNDTSDPYKFLFLRDNSVVTNDFTLPSISAPSLIKLSYLVKNNSQIEANQFLENNPQLECLNIKSDSLDQFKLNYLEKSETLKKLIINYNQVFNEELNLPTLNSIEELQINMVTHDLITKFELLCLNSPNLKELSFHIFFIDHLKAIMKSIIEDILPNLIYLKTLNLIIFRNLENPLVFFNLNRIEKLTIESSLDTIYYIDFSNLKNLKFIELLIMETPLNNDFTLDDIKFKLNSIGDWKFNFKLDTIKGYRL